MGSLNECGHKIKYIGNNAGILQWKHTIFIQFCLLEENFRYRLIRAMYLSSDSFQTLWNTKTNTYAKIKHQEAYSIFG